MEFGAAIFFTDYSMGPVELGQALEARGLPPAGADEVLPLLDHAAALMRQAAV